MKTRNNNNSIAKLLKFAEPYKITVTLAAVLSLLGVISSMIPYISVAKIIETLLNSEKDFLIYLQCIIVAGCGFIGKIVLSNLSTIISHSAAYKTLADIRVCLVDKFIRVPLGFITETPSGNLKDTVVDKVEELEKLVAHLIPEMISNIFAPALIIIYLFTLDWRMALLSLVTLVIGMIILMIGLLGYEEKFRRFTQKGKEMNQAIVEYINGINVIKTFNQSAKSYEKYSTSVNDNANEAYQWMKSCQLGMSLAQSVIPSTFLIILPVGWIFNNNGSLETVEFLTIIILSLAIFRPIMAAVSMVDILTQLKTISKDICYVLDVEELNRPNEWADITNLKIKFENTYFSYSKNGEDVLRGIDLSINENSTVALVGPSGGGKSTIIKLLAGFWDVSEGKISIGDIDIRQIPMEQLNNYISYVSQDNYLFDDTILNNLRMGNPKARDTEIIEAAKACGCHDFILELPQKYHTIVGSAGGHLSGGERQRIAIARAMVKNSPIIIMDEATAYMDPENEAILQEAIGQLISGKTLILIAHRLSTITDVDEIFLVNEGEIVSRGTHNELLVSCDLYNEMWNAHIRGKDSDQESGGMIC